MSSSLSHIVQKFLKIALVFEYVFVKIGHFSNTDNLSALLEECRDADIFSKGQKSVEVAEDLLVGPFFVELFEVLPIALKGSCFDHLCVNYVCQCCLLAEIFIYNLIVIFFNFLINFQKQ